LSCCADESLTGKVLDDDCFSFATFHYFQVDLAKAASRSKRIRIAQEHIVRTAGKENGIFSYRTRPEEVKDIYADDVGNEALVVAYVEHIYGYLHEREVSLGFFSRCEFMGLM
jgi:hypothetical protein